jgi:hypothetical protein
MTGPSIAIVIYADPALPRNALAEPKYSKLAGRFGEKGFEVHSVNYHDSIREILAARLRSYDAVLVWVNPIEQGNDRRMLDELLRDLSADGCFVSAHPDVILKIGTKEILYRTKDEEFGGDVKLYSSFDDFKKRFLPADGATRILKQHRGNGGNGVFKITPQGFPQDRIGVTHATGGEHEQLMTVKEFFAAFEIYFNAGGMLIDQPWNPNIINGMVRCYLSGNKVAGFGYQEINALYPVINAVFRKPSQRFYYSEDCGLFRDLKNIMESKWVKRLQEITGTRNEMLPVIWDADFFINDVNEQNPAKKYSLCEINASCVSPFPESAISYIIDETGKRISIDRRIKELS